MASDKVRRQPDLEILADAERLCIAVYEATGRAPKWHRFRQAKRLEDEAFKLPLLVIEFAESRAKSKAYRLHEQVRNVHSQLRIAIEQKVIKPQSLDAIYGPLSALGNKAKSIALKARAAPPSGVGGQQMKS